MDGELARAGAEEVPFDPNQVAQVEQLVKLEVALPDRVQAHVDLQPRAAARQVRESGLAVRANRHHPARNAHRDFLRVQLLRRARRVLGKDLGQAVSELPLARVKLEAQIGDGLELFLALRVLKFAGRRGQGLARPNKDQK